MKKKYMFSFLLLFAVGVVSAAYLVNSFVLTADVSEPFTVEFANVVGVDPASDPDAVCAAYAGAWVVAGDMDIGTIYPGEAMVTCAKIDNAGAGELGYEFTSVPFDELDVACAAAFPPTQAQGAAAPLLETRAGFMQTVAGDAEPLTDCQVTVELLRE